MSEDARQARLSERLRADMTAAMKSQDALTRDTLRMTIAAVRNAEVAGSTQRELSDDEVLAVLAKESKKRREAAEAFDAAGRTESAAQERAEATVLARYLPTELSDDELATLVGEVVAEGGFSGPQQMGAAMKLVQPKVAGRADGKRVAAEVRRQLNAG
ncbi:MAG: GatB/YqeY domain-containing protein [Actinocatenispora sp.]